MTQVPYDYAVATSSHLTGEEAGRGLFGDCDYVCVDVEDHGRGHATFYFIVDGKPQDFFKHLTED